MINVLTHVVLVEAHRAVRCQSQILCVRQIHMLRSRTRVLKANVPEPCRRALGEKQGYRVVDAAPRTHTHEHAAGRISTKATATLWPQKGCPFDRACMTSQIQIRGAALDLIADKKRERNRIAIETA